MDYFNPLPSHEGRRSFKSTLQGYIHFNPLPSHEGRPETLLARMRAILISIHSPRMRGDLDVIPTKRRGGISIHSPRMRGDGRRATLRHGQGVISIHSPRMRGDARTAEVHPRERISIHSPRMRGDLRTVLNDRIEHISIHSPRMRGDGSAGAQRGSARHFNPLPSHEGRLSLSVLSFVW